MGLSLYMLAVLAVAGIYLFQKELFSYSDIPYTIVDGSNPLNPDRPALKQFYNWLELFNAQDRKALIAYHAANFPYDVANEDIANIDREIALSQHTGGFKFVEIIKPCEDNDADRNDTITVLLREKKRPQFARSSLKVNPSKENNPVTKFEIRPIHTPIKYVPDDRKEEYEKALAPLTPERRHMVVVEICEVIRKQYIFPEIGVEMIEDLQAKESKGLYDNFTESEVWANRLTDDMYAVSKDKHIRVLFSEPLSGENNGDEHDGRRPPNLFNSLKDVNFGFRTPSVEIIRDKKIGILPIDGFVPSTPDLAGDHRKIRKAIGNIVSTIADANALLIDLRGNGGGIPDTVAFVLSYLLDGGPVHLLDFVDRNGTTKYTYSTLPAAELPSGTTCFGGTKPLFVLTSKNTVSGGEEMAYDLQSLKRATSTIGENETTAGAANPVMGESTICNKGFGQGWWRVGIPDMRPVNAVTGSNWEGVGVRSDMIVEEGEDAIILGKRMAMKELELRDALVLQEL